MAGPNFPLWEFQDASHRPLTSAEISAADEWSDTLQGIRDAFNPTRDPNGPRIKVSSFVRTNTTGAHKDGNGIDVVPIGVSSRAVADFIASSGPLATGEIAQVIYYYDSRHLHLARELVPGALAGYLETHDRKTYDPTEPRVGMIAGTDYRTILAALALVLLVVLLV